MAGLTRGEEDLLERHELFLRSGQPRLLIMDVYLDGFVSVDGTDVADTHYDVDSAVGCKRALLQFRSAILESRVRKAVSKSEKGLDLASLIVAIANVDAFTVRNLQILTRPGVVSRGVFDALGESTLYNA